MQGRTQEIKIAAKITPTQKRGSVVKSSILTLLLFSATDAIFKMFKENYRYITPFPPIS